jgi:Fe2+ or Zn2+ uptake regulation protein
VPATTNSQTAGLILEVMKEAKKPLSRAIIHERLCEHKHERSIDVVHQTLDALKDEGYIDRVSPGIYQLVGRLG